MTYVYVLEYANNDNWYVESIYAHEDQANCQLLLDKADNGFFDWRVRKFKVHGS